MNNYKEDLLGMLKNENLSENIKREYLEKLEKLDEISKVNDVENVYNWNEKVKENILKLNKVKKIFENFETENKDIVELKKKIENYMLKCTDNKLNIALVGAIKAGKSTLINALLNTDLASMNEIPETASLTKFVASSNGKNYVRLKFYTENEWDVLWKSVNDSGVAGNVFLEEYNSKNAENEKSNYVNKAELYREFDNVVDLKAEVKAWTSSQSSRHYFVKEVEVGLVDSEIPKNVVYVDTPGLDDVVEYRSNITREYLSKADAVLLCVKADSLRTDEFKTAVQVFANVKNVEQVYILGTQIDTANKPQENWMKQKEEWIKYLKDNAAYRSEYIASKNIIGVSSYMYTLLNKWKDGKINDDSDDDWEFRGILAKFKLIPETLGNEKIEKLFEFSKIQFLRNELKKNIIANKEKYLIENLEQRYLNLKGEIVERMENIKNNQISIIEDSKKSIDEINAQKEKYNLELQKLEDEKKNKDIVIKSIKEDAKNEIDQMLNKIRNLEKLR